jgi:hypothetical protein
MKEINGTTICVNETCQLLCMNQCNKTKFYCIPIFINKIYFLSYKTNLVLSLGQHVIFLVLSLIYKLANQKNVHRRTNRIFSILFFLYRCSSNLLPRQECSTILFFSLVIDKQPTNQHQ